jgi:hypothetical protein
MYSYCKIEKRVNPGNELLLVNQIDQQKNKYSS